MKARRRDEWRVGDRCLMRAGYYSRDGQASKLVPGRVTRLLRDAAEIVLDTGKETTVRLGNLLHDEAWLDEQERREAEKRSRMERERIDLRLVPSEPESKPLTFTLADKLRDSEPPAVDEQTRLAALAQIEALRARRPAETEPSTEPEPEPEPETEPEDVALEPEPLASCKEHPMQTMLERVQAQLLAVYEEHEQATMWAAKLPELERKKRVLEAQEKQVRAALAKLGML